MQELPDSLLAPVLAAMAAMDAAVATQKALASRLAGAIEEAERRDELLRSLPHDGDLVAQAQNFADAMGAVQQLAWREERARREVSKAQRALERARKAAHGKQIDHLRIELEIDAASIWDLVGQFEQQMRRRLSAHAEIAADLTFAAQAAGQERLALPAAASWVPTVGTSGPDLLNALATGVRHLQAHDEPPAIPTVFVERADRTPEVVRPAPQPPADLSLGFGVDVLSGKTAPVLAAPADGRSRIARALTALGRVMDSRPPVKKSRP